MERDILLQRTPGGVESLEEKERARVSGAHDAQLERAMDLLKARHLRDQVIVEASGGITIENIGSYAKAGVDVVSVGAITHSARAIDMSMEIRASEKRG